MGVYPANAPSVGIGNPDWSIENSNLKHQHDTSRLTKYHANSNECTAVQMIVHENIVIVFKLRYECFDHQYIVVVE